MALAAFHIIYQAFMPGFSTSQPVLARIPSPIAGHRVGRRVPEEEGAPFRTTQSWVCEPRGSTSSCLSWAAASFLLDNLAIKAVYCITCCSCIPGSYPQTLSVLQHNSLTCTAQPSVPWHLNHLSSGGTSTEKSPGSCGHRCYTSGVLISPVPMMNPQSLWTWSTTLFPQKGMGNILWIAQMQQLFKIVIHESMKSGKKGYPYSFTAAPEKALLLGWGHKATVWRITGSQFFSSGKKMHITNHIHLPCETEWSKNS